MRYELIDLCNLFCAVCVQLDPSLPLIYHSHDGKIVYPAPSDDLVSLLHDLAFDNLTTYRQLTQATDNQDRQLLKLEIVNLLWTECKDYIK